MNEVQAESTPEKVLEELKQKVQLRDQMGGSLYYNVMNDECCQLANKCLSVGCSRSDIDLILGQGTFTN